MADDKQPTVGDAEPTAAVANNETNEVFQDLDVDRLEVNVVESLCFSCGKDVSVHVREHKLANVFSNN